MYVSGYDYNSLNVVIYIYVYLGKTREGLNLSLSCVNCWHSHMPGHGWETGETGLSEMYLKEALGR